MNSSDSNRGQERQTLLSNLLKSVKACQTKFGGRSELATESDTKIQELCKCWEDVLSHGLRSRPKSSTSSTLDQVTGIVANTFRNPQDTVYFWQFVRIGLTRHELDRYTSLKNIWTDVGRGRAWLRSSLNERSLERYLHILLANRKEAALFFHSWALILDEELNSTLPNMAAGLGSILFAITIDESRLNQNGANAGNQTVSRSEPILAVAVEDVPTQRRRRKTPTSITFDSPEDAAIPTATILSTSAESAGASVASVEEPTNIYCNGELEKPSVSANSPSPSSNDSSMHDFDSSSRKQKEPTESVATLTPVADLDVGELMLISTEDMIPEEGSVGNLDDLSIDHLISRRGEEGLTSAEVDHLFSVLEQLQESNNGLRSKFKNALSRHRSETLSTESRMITLTRENEVLKHQLRKYVSAVQMLNRDGAAHEALAYLEASKMAATQREEAAKYQEQLVEVAQMHGELMEFNERLQKVLLGKEDVIKRLERELIDLRGPLPMGPTWEEDSNAPVPEALINIWIPSAFLTGGSSSVHHLYQVYVRIRDTEWNIYRRYAQFYSLHRELKKKFPVISTLDFPPKKTIGNKDAKFVEERRQRLQKYLRQAIDAVSRARPEISDPSSLANTIPFFSQVSPTEDGKQRTKSASKKKGRSEIATTAQYNGL